MYVVVVQVHVKADGVAAFKEATAENHRATRLEPHNVRFDVLQRLEDPTRFVLYEAYHDEASFSAHQKTDHYLLWKERVADLMAEARSAQKFNSVVPEPWA